MKVYKYDGPVLRKNTNISDHATMHTTAVSAEQAMNNLQHRVGKDRDLVFYYLKEVEPNYSVGDAVVEQGRRCDLCLNLLMDDGRCPLCDGGEYFIPDECELTLDVDDEVFIN